MAQTDIQEKVDSNRGRYPRNSEAVPVQRDQEDWAAEEAEARPAGEQPKLGTSYLNDGTTDRAWERWREIQSKFVDDPRNAVADAHGLVGELIEGIVHQFENERNELEQRWSKGEDVSTEDLRRGLQRYRDFFGRLLAKMDSKV